MGEASRIAWTDHTFNPWWGCTRVSPGCQNCYAETLSKRWGHDVWGKAADRRLFGDKHWAEPIKWNRLADEDGRPHLVFCASMADVFEDRPELVEHRERLWGLIESTPHLIWLLLTKRPENVRRMVPHRWLAGIDDPAEGFGWPTNVWAGTTVEDQQRANERLPILANIPAPVCFVSFEPLLGHIDLTAPPAARIDWAIVGGESGPGHRPIDLDHARSLRDQCLEAGIPFFFKQVGGNTPTAGGDMLDGRRHKAFPTAAHRGSTATA